MSVAIVTGASSGLGREFVEATIDECPDISEIWLVARRKERLDRIAAAHPERRFRILDVDLATTEGLDALARALDESKPVISLLINNAGVGGTGRFGDVELSKAEKMVRLNALAPVVLTRAALPYLHRGSAILNVCSVAGFAPLQNMVTYSSTKAFLLMFSMGLRAELRTVGINVLALSPGNMRTEMFENPKDPSAGTGAIQLLPFLDVPRVARRAIRLARSGRGAYTPRVLYKAYRVLSKLVPHAVIARLGKA